MRTSARRAAGTIETKEGRVNQETYRVMLMQQLLPAIQSRWPWTSAGERVWVQQDNAPAHISPDDPQFMTSAWQQGLNVQLRCQPRTRRTSTVSTSPSSRPFKRANDSARPGTSTSSSAPSPMRTGSSLVDDQQGLLSLQGSMDSCIKDAGGNAFKPLHMAKDKLEQGRLPVSLHRSPEAAAIVSQQYRA